jgi:aspartate/methionine/tyrosine aminotransferase
MGRLGTETAFEVLAAARRLEAQGKDIVHLEIGEPDFDTPSNIIEAANKALHSGKTHYTPAPGIPELRQAIARYVSNTRGISVDPAQVVVVPGGKPIMFYAILALIDEGDEVLYPNPGFPIYESMIRFVGGKAVPTPLREEKQFGLDVGELESLVTDRTKMVIINSPANPTGGVLEAEDIKAIAKLAQERDLIVLADEIYSRIIYDGSFSSIASLPGMPERTIILDGFSKTYAMTGWRIGFGIMPTKMAEWMARLQTNVNSCTSTFTQRACLDALCGPRDEVNAMLTEFRKRRDFIVAGLNKLRGFRCQMPPGAFYAFPNVEGTGIDCQVLANRLLEEKGVACLAGTCFGKHGDGFLRLSYANSIPNIAKALARVEELLKLV